LSRIFVPATSVDDWRQLLADPDKHWKDGKSAMLVANEWQSADGFPPHLVSALAAAPKPINSLIPLIILPEHKVAIPGGARASQNDVWVLASHSGGLASISVEGKVSEPFGETVSDWLVDASTGKLERIGFLLDLLGLPPTPPGTIRYQLLHRVASAIIEAKRFRANLALSIVQSFSHDDDGFADFEAFCGLFGKSVKVGQVINLGVHQGIPFYVAWVRNF
jgi:hypothetical protein